MMNDLNQPKASLKFNDMFHYYLFVEIFVYFDQYKIIKKKVNLNINWSNNLNPIDSIKF